MKLAFIGSGRMAEALLRSILRTELVSAKDVFCSDKNEKRLAQLHNELDVNTVENGEAARSADVVFLCVKPQDMHEALTSIKHSLRRQLVVSVAAGVRLGFLEKELPLSPVIRVMPNIACMVNEMAAGYALGKLATKKHEETLKKLLEGAGTTVSVIEEELDIVTGLSGSGLAFFAAFIDAMAQEATKQGFEQKKALALAIQTALGSAKILEKHTPKELISMVSSPKGTTEAGMDVYKNSKLQEGIRKMVSAAIRRSKELGG